MNPNTIILGGLVALAGAGVAYGVYTFSKFTMDDFTAKLKEERREDMRELAK